MVIIRLTLIEESHRLEVYVLSGCVSWECDVDYSESVIILCEHVFGGWFASRKNNVTVFKIGFSMILSKRVINCDD